jgi:hypothetical protein
LLSDIDAIWELSGDLSFFKWCLFYSKFVS